MTGGDLVCRHLLETNHTAVATLHTNHGDIVVNLYGDHAPRTVKNFVGLSDGTGEWTDPATGKPGDGPLYRGVIFHRIIPNFMIQGGDPLGQGTGGPGYNFNDEIHGDLNFNAPYILAMANAGQRRNPPCHRRAPDCRDEAGRVPDQHGARQSD